MPQAWLDQPAQINSDSRCAESGIVLKLFRVRAFDERRMQIPIFIVEKNFQPGARLQKINISLRQQE